MKPVDGARIAEIVHGQSANGADDAIVTGIARIDSRDIAPGDLFVAFKGEGLDGHDFVDQALQAGAALSLVQRPVTGPHIVVSDTTQAISELARVLLQELRPACRVVAVTGSSGKTTTKDLLASVLSAAAPTVAPPGSFNNEIGLPLTVLRADGGTRFLVLEMGARAEGNIAWLCSLAPPDVSIALNVGSAHVGEFGSLETTARVKGEIVENLAPGGTAIINADDPRVLAMAQRTAGPVLRFSTDPSTKAEVAAAQITVASDGRAGFTLRITGQPDAAVHLQLIGRHQVHNALAVAAASFALGVSSEDIAAGLSSALPSSPMRLQVVPCVNGSLVINDSYNANPESMRAGLQAMRDLAANHRRGLVLGDMLELGEFATAEHVALGASAANLQPDWLVAVGSHAGDVLQGAVEAGMGANAVVAVDNAEAALIAATEVMSPGDVVLVKASRAVALEKVAEGLVTAAGGVQP